MIPRRAWEIVKLPRAEVRPDPPPPKARTAIGSVFVELRPEGPHRKTAAWFVYNELGEVLAMRLSWDGVLDLLGLWPDENKPVREASTPSSKGPAVPIEQFYAEQEDRRRGALVDGPIDVPMPTEDDAPSHLRGDVPDCDRCGSGPLWYCDRTNGRYLCRPCWSMVTEAKVVPPAFNRELLAEGPVYDESGAEIRMGKQQPATGNLELF